MAYVDIKIQTAIDWIKESKLYLPAIQRKLVWNHEQIESLFDSIMRGYPIGTFLFWKLEGDAVDTYTFYKFIQEYEHKKSKNEIAPKPEYRNEIMGVLDGQQRLNSIFIALQGTYAYKKPHARWNNPKAFPKRKFYLNLLYSPSMQAEEKEFDVCEECGYDKVPLDATICPGCGTQLEEEEGGISYEFKFLTDGEKDEIDNNHFWFPISKVLTWKDVTSADDFFEECIEKHPKMKEVLSNKDKKRQFKTTLVMLWQRIVSDKMISYYEVNEPVLDNILDIFVRVNSGGTILSKTDLLFSTIVAHWENGRAEIEDLLENINSKGNRFNFNNDFIMRSCLVLTDCQVLFKVKTFKGKNVQKIKKEWDNIKDAIEKTIDLISEWGFSRDNLTSQMSIIPIAYFFIKKGKDYKIDESNKKSIRGYLITSLLKQIYGGQGDQVLAKIRDVMVSKDSNELISKDFPIDLIKSASLPSNKSLEFVDEDIDEILQYSKGPYTFMVLSLLYPNLKYGQVKFHQDHMHPASQFTYSKLNKLNVVDTTIWAWQEVKDRLPNLQLMEGLENESKSKTPLKEWFEKNIKDKEKYKKENYIPEDVDLDILAFDDFYKKRSKILKEKIKETLLK